MVESKEEIYRRIPHRPPFLWVDRIVSLDEEMIVAEKEISLDLPLFAGHYPHYPIMPGVLLCEAVFQAGALLISEKLDSGQGKGVPVLTRIYGAKFKRSVHPGDVVRLEVRFKEMVGPAWVLKGKALVHDKTVMNVEFACMLLPEEQVE